MTANRPWLLALLALTALRLAAAAALPLSGDEAYYWVWSHALAPGYLDHPPMVALWIAAGTGLVGQGALGVRLLGPLSAAGGTLLLARAAGTLLPGSGVPAAALFNGTLLLGAGAVTMTPDTPLVFFWTLALWALARLLVTGRGAWWLAVGAASGLALDSKYTGGFLGVGIVLWLAWVPGLRHWFRSAWLWAGGAAAVALFAPVLAWNAGHGWASLAKQGGRGGAWDPSAAPGHLLELVAGQVGLATPLVFLALVFGVVTATRRALGSAGRGAWGRDPACSLLAALTLPGLLVFVQHAVGDRVQANWPAILYPAAAIAGGAVCRRLWRPAAVLGLALTSIATLQAVAAPLALPRRWDPALIRLGGWDTLARDADALREQAGAGWMTAEGYPTTALLAWWRPGPVLAADSPDAAPRWSLIRLPAAAPPGPILLNPGLLGPDLPGPGLLLISQRHREPPDPALWASADPVGELVRARNGVEAERFRAYRVLPRPGIPLLRLPSAMAPPRLPSPAPLPLPFPQAPRLPLAQETP